MKASATLIHENGDSENIIPENGKDFNLKELYKLLNCDMVELLYLPTKEYMIIDEEGKLKPNPQPNIVASTLYKRDIIVGKAIVCSKSMFK